MSSWPIFICYRQTDGKAAASRIFDLLNEQSVPLPAGADEGQPLPSLDLYFDQAAPGVEDWRAVHEPYLKRARAIIVICTPGSKLNEGPQDWVHREIGWWLENRDMAPILVDPLGEDLRYVPGSIAKRWPNAQRIRVIEQEWERLSEEDRRLLDDRVRSQFLGAIIPSGETFYRQELEQEKERSARLRRTTRIATASVVALLAVIGVAVWTYQLKGIADQAASEAEARVTQIQAARTMIETRLLGIMQRFEELGAYHDVMAHWEEDFSLRAVNLNIRARAALPPCDEIAGGTVYEGQMVPVEVNGLPENEYLFVYLAQVPGSSDRQGDWFPAVLDVYFSDEKNVTTGRNLSREDVKAMMRHVDEEDQWALLMGLGAPHVLNHLDENYQLSMTGLEMNGAGEGEMIMEFSLCRESERPADPDNGN